MSSIGGPFQPFDASRHINAIQSQKAGVLNQLATGSRINRAADDPAGLVSSEQLKGMLKDGGPVPDAPFDGLEVAVPATSSSVRVVAPPPAISDSKPQVQETSRLRSLLAKERFWHSL